MAQREREIEALQEQCVDKERQITEQDQTILQRDQTIAALNAEIERLNGVIQQNGMAAGDLQQQMADLMRKLQESEATTQQVRK